MLWLFVALLACRPDPGAPDYPDPPRDTGSDYLPGPNPYIDGEDRLSLGFFYEGPYTELDVPENLYIYENTFGAGVTEDDVIEGTVADVWTHAGLGWWGGGIHWDAARDLSSWGSLNIALKSPADGGIPTVDLAMQGNTEGRLTAETYGFAADGEWHNLIIPLADFATAGTDLSQVTVPLILIDEGGAQGDQLFIDNLFLE